MEKRTEITRRPEKGPNHSGNVGRPVVPVQRPTQPSKPIER